MIRKLRKYNKWFMAIFGVLLMLTWLAGPATNRMSSLGDRVVAKLDGRSVRGSEQQLAARELMSLSELAPTLTRGVFQVEDRDHLHWLMLSDEARQAGLVGEEGDGRQFLEMISRELAKVELRQNMRLLMQLFQDPNPPKTQEEALQRVARSIVLTAPRIFLSQNRMTEEEMNHALAKAAGVYRLVGSYQESPRVSDRQAVAEARKSDDAAVVDFAFLPAEALAPLIPDPDAATLQAHFERLRGTRPGEGDYGVGYLLPKRVKLEWLTLDRKAIEDAVVLDPVEVHKRYRQNPDKYKGDLAQVRPQVEADMKAEQAARIMQEAQLVIQAEAAKATRKLEPEGRYRKLPADWEASRPKLSAVAQAVQEQVGRTVGMPIPLPAVTTKDQWLTERDLTTLPGIGRSTLRQGGLEIPLSQVVFWTRELGNPEGPIPVQVGIPLSENYLSDGVGAAGGNRYYITVLTTRDESAPDNAEEIREQAVRDYKNVQAFERLKARADELRQAAVAGGVEAAATAFAGTALPAGKKPEKPAVQQAAKVKRVYAEGADLNRDEAIRTTIMDAAEKLDPKAPPDQHPADQATLAIPSSKALGMAIVRLRAFVPVTREDYLRMDRNAAQRAKDSELRAASAAEPPFGLDALLRRHNYTVGSERVHDSKELRRQEKDESKG
jgi:hypothetical protein